MRHLVSIVALLLLIGSIPAVSVTAQQSSLLDLLPTAADLGPAFVVVDNRTRTLAEQATGFANADEAARLLAGWDWQENVFQVFQTVESTPTGAPLATLDISLTRFANAEGAALALPYFLSDRAAVLAQHEVKSQNLTPRPIGDETRVLSGPVEGGDDTTLYVRTGALLLRLSLTTTSGAPAMSPQEIAQGIVDRATTQSPSSTITVMQPAAEPLLDTLPLDHAACFSVEGEGELDVPAVVERLATGADASAELAGSRLAGWRLPPIHLQAACGPGRLGRYQRPSLPRCRIGCRGRRLFRGIAGGEHGSATRPGAHDRRQQRRAGRSRGQWHGILALPERGAVALRRHRGRTR